MKNYILILFIITITNLVMAQNIPDTLWTKTFGGLGYDQAMSIKQTSDGGFIVLGITSSFGAGSVDIWLIKIDEDGNELWQQTFGGVESDYAKSIQQTNDGGFIIIGNTESFGTGYNKIWLIKTDELGNEQWNQTYGNYDNRGNSVIQTDDGGYILAGSTWILGNNNYFDLILIKTDEFGNEEWSQIYGGSLWDEALYIQQNQNNEFIICGYTGEIVAWLLKTDEIGNIIWEHTFGDDAISIARQFIQTPDMGYILTGYTCTSGDGDIWVFKTNEFGYEEWSQTYDGNEFDEAYSICETSTDGFIIAGATCTNSVDEGDIWIIKIDENGEEEWNQTFGGNSADLARSIQHTEDNGFIIAGATCSYGNGYYDFWIIRLGPEVSSSEELVFDSKNYFNILNYPNPFNPSTTISFNISRKDAKNVGLRSTSPGQAKDIEIIIYNIKGQKVKTLADNNFEKGKHSAVWNGADDSGNLVSSGVYFYKLKVNGKNEVVKKCLLLK